MLKTELPYPLEHLRGGHPDRLFLSGTAIHSQNSPRAREFSAEPLRKWDKQADVDAGGLGSLHRGA